MFREVFGGRLIDNQMRGPWAEHVAAEALGDKCQVVSHGWHARDPEIADHLDPTHWLFYMVPISGRNAMFPVGEPNAGQKSKSSYFVRPAALQRAEYKHAPVDPMSFEVLRERGVSESLGI
ncbi:MAG: hypothetical protein CL566_11355 [Alphaproteobacteria bacterium]|nr:hypothetical protein [Alphaproteobacteria bacterium]